MASKKVSRHKISMPDEDASNEYKITPSLWCPIHEYKKPVLVCIYRCTHKTKCPAYAENYENICDMPIDEFYLDKYGYPEYPKPDSLARSEKRALKELKAADKAAKKMKRERKQAEKEDAPVVKKTKTAAEKTTPKEKKVAKPSSTKKLKKPAKKLSTNVTDLTGDW